MADDIRLNVNKMNDFSAGFDKDIADGSFEQKAMNSYNLFTRKQIDANRFEKFCRYGLIDPYNSHMYTKEYLFFTKPDLHVFERYEENGKMLELNKKVAQNDYFAGAILTNRRSLELLQQTYFQGGFDARPIWNTLLSNQVSSKLDLPNIAADMTEHNTNLYGIRQYFRDSSRAQEYGFDFNLEFKDTVNLDVYHFFKAYNEYCNFEYEADIPPFDKHILNNIRYKEFSIYKIVVNDVNRIVYYAKHIGVTIKGLPMDAMTDVDGVETFSVPMHTFHVVELKPYILNEINMLTIKQCGSNISSSSIIPLYDAETNMANTEWGTAPFITSEKVSNSSYYPEYHFYLQWRR